MIPSFDIVCDVNEQEMDNAVNQVKKEITTRYDFKHSQASILLKDGQITLVGDDVNNLNTVAEILRAKMVRRKLEVNALEYGDIEAASGDTRRQIITVKQGVDKDSAKKIVKKIKDEKMKVQASIQGDQVRVTGKKRDDLQQTIALLKQAELDLPLQYDNFRD
ncbi:MAG: YajQ family cyclic di-GMP-binding protein [Mariprofundaceae bacterium]|nr:YajQ family cyclic di-GMP-binding protein [Mariprofundaceae bacterium]